MPGLDVCAEHITYAQPCCIVRHCTNALGNDRRHLCDPHAIEFLASERTPSLLEWAAKRVNQQALALASCETGQGHQ